MPPTSWECLKDEFDIGKVIDDTLSGIDVIGPAHHHVRLSASKACANTMQWLNQYGLNARFLLFILATMIGSIIVGSFAAGFAASVRTGDPEYMLVVPFIVVVGAAITAPWAFFLWIVPSALVFVTCMVLLKRSIGVVMAAQWSGSITALVAALVATYVATDFGRDFDGVGGVMFFIGPAAVALAPWLARKAYAAVDEGLPQSPL